MITHRTRQKNPPKEGGTILRSLKRALEVRSKTDVEQIVGAVDRSSAPEVEQIVFWLHDISAVQ